MNAREYAEKRQQIKAVMISHLESVGLRYPFSLDDIEAIEREMDPMFKKLIARRLVRAEDYLAHSMIAANKASIARFIRSLS